MTPSALRLPPPPRRVLIALARVTCPPEIDELGIAEAVADETAGYIAALPRYIRVALVTGLTAFEASAAVLPGSFGRPFSRLDRAPALAHFERYWSSHLMPLHELARSIKALLVAAYYEQPIVKQRMGFTPEVWIADVKARREGSWAPAIDEHEALLRAPDPLIPAPRAPQEGGR